jgi:MFS superfamily sulfate permease-like transporter
MGLSAAVAGMFVYAIFGTSANSRLRYFPVGSGASCTGNLEASPEIDVTSLEMLDQLRSELAESHIAIHFARVSDEAHDLFSRSGFQEPLGQDRIFRGVDVAVNEFLNRSATFPQVGLEETRA